MVNYRSYSWMGTSFDLVYYKKSFRSLLSKGGIVYFTGQIEICPQSHRLHLQFYIEMTSRCTLRNLKSLLPDKTAHLEIRRGSQEQAIEYVHKMDSRVDWGLIDIEFGTKRIEGRGARNDLHALTDSIVSGTRLSEIALEHASLYVKYHRGLHALQLLVDQNDRLRTSLQVRVYWGETGTGKTRRAYEECMKLGGCYITNNTKWFDGWDGYCPLILDEFNPKFWPADYLKRLLDIYPLKVQCKGGHIQVNTDLIIITTNIDPKDWYVGDHYEELFHDSNFIRTIEAIRRRLTSIEYFSI